MPPARNEYTVALGGGGRLSDGSPLSFVCFGIFHLRPISTVLQRHTHWEVSSDTSGVPSISNPSTITIYLIYELGAAKQQFGNGRRTIKGIATHRPFEAQHLMVLLAPIIRAVTS